MAPDSGKVLQTFKDFPPRAEAASFTVGDAMEEITTASAHQNQGGGPSI